jgi:HPt (histidine-containing phosphotransfer) domain-containing protein
MDGYLSKPLSAVDLARVLNQLTAPNRRKRFAADSLPELDESAIETLRSFLPPDRIEAMLTESLTDIESRVSRLGARLDAADYAGAAKEAHDIVSVAGNCGARAMSALARDIERGCRQGPIADAVDGFARLLEIAPGAIGALASVRDEVAREVGSASVAAGH